MTKLPKHHHDEAIDLTEALIDAIRQDAQKLLNGLADRPKAGAKATAREAANRIITMNGQLWRFIEGKKPITLTTGDDGETSPSL